MGLIYGLEMVEILSILESDIVEPLYKGHAGTMKSVLYMEVSFIQRLNYMRKY